MRKGERRRKLRYLKWREMEMEEGGGGEDGGGGGRWIGWLIMAGWTDRGRRLRVSGVRCLAASVYQLRWGRGGPSSRSRSWPPPGRVGRVNWWRRGPEGN